MPSHDTARIVQPRLRSLFGLINILEIYASTICSTTQLDHILYDEFEAKLSTLANAEHLFTLGDLDASVNSDRDS